jgi:hypothetical protein
MPRANQHWVEELDFAIEEWTLDGVHLVEVLGRVHLLEMAREAGGPARPWCRLVDPWRRRSWFPAVKAMLGKVCLP